MAADVPSFHFSSGSREPTPPPPPPPPPPTKETTFTLPNGDDDDEGLFDGNMLSPLSARFPPYNPLNASLNSPARSSHLSPYSPSTLSSDTDAPSHSPFNFTPQQYVVGRP